MSYQRGEGKIFAQGLFEESATKIHMLGTVRRLEDGRVFQYAKAGAVALAAGKLNSTVVSVAEHVDEAVVTAAAIGDTSVAFTPAAAAAAANLYADGFYYVNDGTGEGHMYKIKSHAALVASTAGVINLYDPIRVATVATTSLATLAVNPQANLVITATTYTGLLAGVAPRAVTASNYFWNQVRGPAVVLTAGTVVVGAPVSPITTAGAVGPYATTAITPQCGYCMVVNVTTDYSLIYLEIA